MPPPRPRPQRPKKSKSVQYRRFRGVNLTDSRPAIDDDELAWLENAMTVGNGAIQILPHQATAVASIGAGVASLWGFTLNGSPVLISINDDGSVSQITTGGVVTAVAAAGTVTTSAHCAIWQGTPILVVDPTNGYFSWDGTTWTVIDATKTGRAIASFEGRVWIGNGRTIVYTAPNSHTNFTAGDGAGSTVITDDAFQGNIVAMVSALEQLWILGQSAIEALANVQASGTSPNVVTTFSITNIVSNLGSNAPNSAIGYFRALAFMAPFGAYALSGVTPQKLSDKLDGLYPDLTFTDAPAAVAVVQSLPCLLYLVTYNGTNAQAGAGPIPLLLGFTQGKWFFAYQGALTWITTLIVDGVSQAWGTDGANIYHLFGAPATTPVGYKVQTKQFDFGLPLVTKAMLKVGLEYQATNPIEPDLAVDSELSSQTATVAAGNELIFINNSGDALTMLNNVLASLIFVSQALVLSYAKIDIAGKYLGATVTGEDPPYRIQAIDFEVTPTREW
jgi:hypothetical protein